LEAGHFKGVADVRLRINFFDELSGQAKAAAQEALPGKVDELVQALGEEIGALVKTAQVSEEQQGPIDEILAESDAAVQAAIEESTANGSLESDGLSDALQSAFDSVLTALRGLFDSPDEALVEGIEPDAALDNNASDTVVEETGVEAVVEATEVPEATTEETGPGDETGETPTASLEDALVALGEFFDAALADLLASIDESPHLSDPAPYPGNGAAYEKFLAIYNDLRGVSASGEHDELA